MTEEVFNLNCRLVCDRDRGRKSDRRLIEQLIGETLNGVIPEAIVLKVSMEQVTMKK